MRSPKILATIFALLVLAAGAGGEARAQFFGTQPDPVPPPPWAGPEEWVAAPAPPRQRVCKKLCANDFSPCDPIYFKTEDGRCDGLDLGR